MDSQLCFSLLVITLSWTRWVETADYKSSDYDHSRGSKAYSYAHVISDHGAAHRYNVGKGPSHSRHYDTVVQTITKQVPYPVPQPYPVTVETHVPYAVSVPVAVPVNRPYPVPVPKPYPVTVEKPVPVAVERPYPYPVKYPVKVPVPTPVPVAVPQPYPVYVKDHTHSYHGYQQPQYRHSSGYKTVESAEDEEEEDYSGSVEHDDSY